MLFKPQITGICFRSRPFLSVNKLRTCAQYMLSSNHHDNNIFEPKKQEFIND